MHRLVFFSTVALKSAGVCLSYLHCKGTQLVPTWFHWSSSGDSNMPTSSVKHKNDAGRYNHTIGSDQLWKKITHIQAAVCPRKQFRISLVFHSVAWLSSFTTLWRKKSVKYCPHCLHIAGSLVPKSSTAVCYETSCQVIQKRRRDWQTLVPKKINFAAVCNMCLVIVEAAKYNTASESSRYACRCTHGAQGAAQFSQLGSCLLPYGAAFSIVSVKCMKSAMPGSYIDCPNITQ